MPNVGGGITNGVVMVICSVTGTVVSNGVVRMITFSVAWAVVIIVVSSWVTCSVVWISEEVKISSVASVDATEAAVLSSITGLLVLAGWM